MRAVRPPPPPPLRAQGIDWSNLAKQKAAFIPQPEDMDDTSYFQVGCGDAHNVCR